MKIVNKTDFRLVIEPESVPWLSENKKRAELQWEAECWDFRDEIIKLKIPHIKSMNVEWDEEHLCSFCNEQWEWEPRCCDAAIEEWEEIEMNRDYL